MGNKKVDLEFIKSNLEHVSNYISSQQLEIINNKNIILSKIDKVSNKINELQKENKSNKEEIDINYHLFSPKENEHIDRSINITNKLMTLSSELEELENELNILLLKETQTIELIDKIHFIVKQISKETNVIDYNLNESDDFRINLLEYQEIDRKRIARDLHDTTVQNLTNLVHKTELCSKLVDIDTVRVKLELQTMIGTIRNTINELRTIIYDLRPMSLDDLGLVVTIEQYVNKLMINSDLVINFNVENEEVKLLPIINLAIFRVIQEACSNVIKHARAKKIDINLSYSNESLDLSIEDDGIGFNFVETIKNDNSNISNFGLSIMKERIYLLSGKIDFITEEGKGTKILIKIPMYGRGSYESNKNNNC